MLQREAPRTNGLETDRQPAISRHAGRPWDFARSSAPQVLRAAEVACCFLDEVHARVQSELGVDVGEVGFARSGVRLEAVRRCLCCLVLR